ncbi:MAG: peptidase C25 [candidate division Zixibacteria bacterium]|nr:peptidase C25 [candidate division Zixibacteria bacterium]
MKKIIVGILVLSWLGAVAMTDDTTYYAKNIEESIVISEPVIEETDQYVTVGLKETASSLSKAGEPVLPVVTKVFILPFGSKISHVDVNFSETSEIVLSRQVQPGPQPIPKTGMRAPREQVQNDEIYESVELYPASSFSYTVGAGIKGDERIIFLKVHCYPVRYSPGLNILSYSESVDIRVSYDEPVVPISFPDDYDMVIIAPSMFSEELQPLIDHKNSRGVQTILKTTEEIYAEYMGRDEPEQIKYFIKDAIETWGVRFVLLVGGASQLPGRYTHIYFEYDYQDYWVFLSDLYYADVYDDSLNFSSWDSNDNDVFGEYNWYGNYDDVDLYPDVYLGRLACVNENEVITCVNKIITYETGEAHTQDWFTNLVLMGGDSLPGDEEQIDEGEYVNQHVMDTLDWFIPVRVWASNGLLFDAANISDAINNGAGFVFFNGHGNTTVWATHPHESYQWIPPGYYTNSHINALTNGGKLPIVVSDACYHCQYDAAPYCFGWTFVTNPNGGSIAYLGGTDIDVSYGGVDIVTKGIERLCVIMSKNYKEGDATFGELWGNGISTYLSPVMDEIDYITVEEFQPLGILHYSSQVIHKNQPNRQHPRVK